MDDGTARAEVVDPKAVLGAIAAATDAAIVVVRPTVVDAAVTDAAVVWHNAAALLVEPRLAVGSTAVGFFGSSVSGWQLATSSAAALAAPGRSLRLCEVEHVVEGTERTYDVTLRAHDGFIVYEIVDRTDEHRARGELAASEARFRQMLDGLEAGAVLLAPVLDTHGEITDASVLWANRASERMWAEQQCLRPGALVSETYYDAPEWIDAARVAWAEGSVRRMLEPHPTRTPWTAAVEVLRRVGDTLLEFTVDRSTDEALLTQLDELDHRFASLIAELPLTVVVWEVGSDRLEFISPNITELTGYPASELATLSSLERHVHPDDLPSREALTTWLDANDGHYHGVWRLRRSDGVQIQCEVRATRRVGPAGALGVVALITDVTEQRRLLERAESSERLRSLGRTAGSIAHDFNNLLMIVSGNIERAQRHSAVELPALATAAAAAQRAGDLAQSLLSFARGRPGSPRLLDLGELVRSAEPIAQATAGSATSVVVSVEPDLPQVFADPTHVEQILLNLVTNSRDAITSRGTIVVEVFTTAIARCHLDDTGDSGATSPGARRWAAISVSDTGCGIPHDLQAAVWEPYFSRKELSRESGSGLGLSTVHGLVHQYGGHAALESGPGEGTTVTVYLPAVAAVDGEAR